MPSFTIKVPNDDEGEDLGEYQADYLPRVGEPFVLWHPRLSSKSYGPDKKDEPFCAVVSTVTHEAFNKNHPYARENVVTTTVWLVEEHAAPTLYCDCSGQERDLHGATDGECNNCGHARQS